MGIIIEFFAVPATPLPLDTDEQRMELIQTLGKPIGTISVNSNAVAAAFALLLQTDLAGLAGDGADSRRTVFVSASRYLALTAQVAAWAVSASDPLRLDLAFAITEAITDAQWSGDDLAVQST